MCGGVEPLDFVGELARRAPVRQQLIPHPFHFPLPVLEVQVPLPQIPVEIAAALSARRAACGWAFLAHEIRPSSA